MLTRNKVAIVVVAVGIGVVSAYAIGTSDQVVAHVLRRELATYVRAPCTFESASFTFLKGLEVHGLTVLDPTDPLGRALLFAAHAHIDYKLDVTGAGPHMTGIGIEKPSVRLERTATGSFPIQTAFFFPSPVGPAPPRPLVRLSGGEVTLADPAVLAGGPIALTGIDVTVTPATPKATDFAGATIELTASSDVLGLVSAHARVGKSGTSARVELDLPRIVVDPSLLRRFADERVRRIAEMSPSGEVTARITVRIEEGKDFAAEADLVLLGVALRQALPEPARGVDPPRPIEVAELNGDVHFAPGRLEARNLVFRALGAVFEADATLSDLATDDPQIDATTHVRGLPLTRELLEFMPRAARRIAEAYFVTGTVEAGAALRGAVAAPAVTVDTKIVDGRFSFEGFVQEDGVRRGFPWMAESVSGAVSFDGRTILIEGNGVHGPARVHAKGTVVTGHGETIPDVAIFAQDVPLDGDLRAAFGDRADKFFDRWGPSGVARRIDVHVSHVDAVGGDHDVTEVTIGLDGGAGFTPRLLPVPLSDVTGKVEVLEPVVDGRRESLVRLTQIAAKADGFTIAVAGEIHGSGDAQREDLQVGVATSDAGGGFREAVFAAPDSTLAPGVKDAVRKLGASGPVTIDAHLVKEATQVRHDVVKIALVGTSVTGWDDIPLAGRALTGRVTLAQDTLTFEDITGNLVMDEFLPLFTAHGRLLGVSGTPQFDVHVESPEIPLGEALRKALGPLATKARRFWEDFHPVEGAHAGVVLDLRPDSDPTPFEVTLSHLRGGLMPLGLELDNDDGTFHYDGRTAEIRGLESAIGSASVRFDEADLDVATGRVTVRASVRNLHFPEDLEGPLSAETVAKIVDVAPGRLLHASDVHLVFEPDPAALEIAGVLSIRPRTRRPLPDPGFAPDGVLAFDRLVFWMLPDRPVFFQGEARTEDFALRAGLALDKLSGPIAMSGTLGHEIRLDLSVVRASLRADGYPFDDVTATVAVLPRGTRVSVSKAKFMSGTLEGLVGPGDESVAYQGHFTLTDADLERLLSFKAAPGKEVATGTLDASLRFSNATGARSDLRGEGQVSVHDGRLAPSPIFSAIWGLLSLGLGSQPVLSDGKMKFEAEGEWLNVRELSVTGTGGALENGRGKIGLDGRLDLSVAPRLDIPVPFLRQILQLIQMPFVPRVHLGGTLRNPMVSYEIGLTGEGDRRREPQPEGDVEGPKREPW
jgi:hypothetical protein